ncbi:MAG: hypothetical protein JWR83_1661 [Aeromicrobium sp.]|nr:hypothetical protein [Aeromicrobium sp.]
MAAIRPGTDGVMFRDDEKVWWIADRALPTRPGVASRPDDVTQVTQGRYSSEVARWHE